MPRPLLASEAGVSRVQDALAALDLDGWLLYESRGEGPQGTPRKPQDEMFRVLDD